MRTPGHIALIGACAIALAIVVATLGTALFHLSGTNTSLGYSVLSAFIAGLTIGALVWCGTYIGARFTPADQRGNGLSVWLASIFFAVGIVLSLPIKTHAILVDMPAPSAQGSQSPAVGSITIFLLPLVLILLLPMVLTRIVAIVLARGKGRDA